MLCLLACLLACLRKANASAVQQAATVLTGIDPVAGALAFLPLVDYKLITNYPSVQLPQVFENYPDVPSEASPYYNAQTATSAGTTQNLDSRIYEPFASNQYKRSSSFYGDFTFNAHRRTYLQGTQLRGRRNKDKTWSFQFSQNDKSPVSCIATI
ncbi:hypothetical protein NDA12_004987 [Ustilago hordei]|nr:hypothetical protein NDA12_004987 [Ustilago hordei]